jgi:hypothetical protein
MALRSAEHYPRADAMRTGDLADVIESKTTRPRLISALEFPATKRDRDPPKQRGNLLP